MTSGKPRVATKRRRVIAVLDTNVFVAAYLSRNPNSPTQEILARWLNDEFDLLYSVDLQAEIAEKFAAKGVAQDATELLLAAIAIRGMRVETPASAVVAMISADPDARRRRTAGAGRTGRGRATARVTGVKMGRGWARSTGFNAKTPGRQDAKKRPCGSAALR